MHRHQRLLEQRRIKNLSRSFRCTGPIITQGQHIGGFLTGWIICHTSLGEKGRIFDHEHAQILFHQREIGRQGRVAVVATFVIVVAGCTLRGLRLFRVIFRRIVVASVMHWWCPHEDNNRVVTCWRENKKRAICSRAHTHTHTRIARV